MEVAGRVELEHCAGLVWIDHRGQLAKPVVFVPRLTAKRADLCVKSPLASHSCCQTASLGSMILTA